MNIFKSYVFLLAAMFILSANSLSAEIEYIIVRWLPTACQDTCALGVSQQLFNLPGAAEVIVNQQEGQATIRWKPRVPFGYDAINTAMRMIGPAVQDVRMRVRGTVAHTPSAFILQSLGDNTQFVLLSPAQASMTQYVPQNNFDSHQLAPDVQARFLEGEKDSAVVVVEGPLFEPQRMQGLYLIVQTATFNRLKQK